jgi:hypothetical protein
MVTVVATPQARMTAAQIVPLSNRHIDRQIVPPMVA